MTSPDKHISLGMCNISGDNTNSKTTAYRSTLQEIKTNLMDRLGGEIRIRNVSGNLVLDYLTSYGSESSTTIELAKNIRSLNVSTDSTTIVTRLIPLGAQLDSSSFQFTPLREGRRKSMAMEFRRIRSFNSRPCVRGDYILIVL